MRCEGDAMGFLTVESGEILGADICPHCGHVTISVKEEKH
jgi:hypothetical protein